VVVPKKIAAMEQASWTHEHTSMFARFWQVLCDHEFQSNNDTIDHRGLIVYQVEKQIEWYTVILSSNSGGGWDIGIISEVQLEKT